MVPRRPRNFVPKTGKLPFGIERLARGADGSDVLLILFGSVDTAAASILGPTCVELLAASYDITLDLSNVDSANPIGLQLFNNLLDFGATMINVPRDVASRLDHHRVSPSV